MEIDRIQNQSHLLFKHIQKICSSVITALTFILFNVVITGIYAKR